MTDKNKGRVAPQKQPAPDHENLMVSACAACSERLGDTQPHPRTPGTFTAVVHAHHRPEMEGYVYVRNPGKLVDLMFCSHREAELKAKLGVDQEGLDELEEQLSLLERAGTFWQEETDNQGQILFYTGLYRTSDGTVVPFEPEDEEEDNVESSVGK